MLRSERSLELGLGLALLGCLSPPSRSHEPAEPTRISILDPRYAGAETHPDALALGARIEPITLPLADLGEFELATATKAGPVVLVWIGGIEHAVLTAWARELDRRVAELEQRSATLVFVRPLEPAAALRWAADLHLQTAVASDPSGALADLLGRDAESLELGREPLDEFAVMIAIDGVLRYRKLGGRVPELDELLAVLDGEAESLRCCPNECSGDPCE